MELARAQSNQMIEQRLTIPPQAMYDGGDAESEGALRPPRKGKSRNGPSSTGSAGLKKGRSQGSPGVAKPTALSRAKSKRGESSIIKSLPKARKTRSFFDAEEQDQVQKEDQEEGNKQDGPQPLSTSSQQLRLPMTKAATTTVKRPPIQD
jgi:hypothetical protein